MEMHNRESNTDSVNRDQYHARKTEKDMDNYLICVLHQNKVPCSVKGCHYIPFGMIRKSYLIDCSKGILRKWVENGEAKEVKIFPFFPDHSEQAEKIIVPIDMTTRTVTIKGVPIRLKI
jgi:hypothetical protein